jgi:hypothetical protein
VAIQIQGNGGVVADVDGTTFRALRVTARPVNYGALGMYRVGAISGTMAAALGAGAELFQFRWPDASNLALLYKLSISAGANVAATAAAIVGFVMSKCTAWTAAGSGGTRLTLTTPNAKLRNSMGAPLVNDMGISTTAGLTAGTKTIDTTNMGALAFGIGTGAITTSLPLSFVPPESKLFDAYGEGMHPLVMVQNEGFIIRNGAVAFPATMTWNFAVNCVWAEAAAF